MIMLLLLSLIGVSASQNSGMEERMAGNSRDKNLAFQAAESALIAAEQFLSSADLAGTLPTFTAAGTGGFYLNNPTGDILSDSFWQTGLTVSYTGTLVGTDSTSLPRYIIQDLGCVAPCTTPASDPHNYRITAYATGGTTAAVAVLQSIFRI